MFLLAPDPRIKEKRGHVCMFIIKTKQDLVDERPNGV